MLRFVIDFLVAFFADRRSRDAAPPAPKSCRAIRRSRPVAVVPRVGGQVALDAQNLCYDLELGAIFAFHFRRTRLPTSGNFLGK